MTEVTLEQTVALLSDFSGRTLWVRETPETLPARGSPPGWLQAAI